MSSGVFVGYRVVIVRDTFVLRNQYVDKGGLAPVIDFIWGLKIPTHCIHMKL